MRPRPRPKPDTLENNSVCMSTKTKIYVCFKVSVSAVFCLDILQLYSVGLSFDWHSVYFVQL